MASKRFGKGSPEWNMFGDYWKLCQTYWILEDADSYFHEAINAAKDFHRKYKKIDPIFSMQITLAFINTIEEKNKEMTGKESIN